MPEPGVTFNFDGNHFSITVEEAWTLRGHLPASTEPIGGASAQVRVWIEKAVHEADGLEAQSPPFSVFESEKIAIRLALDNWLHAVKSARFPGPRVGASRRALHRQSGGGRFPRRHFQVPR
jgi:hypothetical protein